LVSKSLHLIVIIDAVRFFILKGGTEA